MTRDSRTHPDVRTGSSVRGSIDFVLIANELGSLRGVDPREADVTLDAALLALSGRIRLREGSARSAEDVVRELWAAHFAPTDPADTHDDGGEGEPGKG